VSFLLGLLTPSFDDLHSHSLHESCAASIALWSPCPTPPALWAPPSARARAHLRSASPPCGPRAVLVPAPSCVACLPCGPSPSARARARARLRSTSLPCAPCGPASLPMGPRPVLAPACVARRCPMGPHPAARNTLFAPGCTKNSVEMGT
jgi:hypothetical protein